MLSKCKDAVASTTEDIFSGTGSEQELAYYRGNVHKKDVVDTGGIPY